MNTDLIINLSDLQNTDYIDLFQKIFKINKILNCFYTNNNSKVVLLLFF